MSFRIPLLYTLGQTSNTGFSYDDTRFKKLQFIWLYLRKYNQYDQAVPTFNGGRQFGRKFVEQVGIQKNCRNLLQAKSLVSLQFQSIWPMINNFQSLAESSNMSYVCIILDVGAAMNAYKFLWSKQHLFGNIMIHLGDFHFMTENFQVVKHYITLIHAEDIVIRF